MKNNRSYIKKGIRLSSRVLNKIHNSPVRTTERAFNSIPRQLQNMMGVTFNAFKRHLDEWIMKSRTSLKGMLYFQVPELMPYVSRSWSSGETARG